MKKVLLLILLCVASYVRAADVRFISANTGNDSNSGVDFANAWLTLGKAVTDGQAAGDTVVIAGTFTELLSPSVDGTSGNSIVWIDSVYYTDGFPAVVDTTWLAIIDGSSLARCVDLSSDDFHKFIHIDMFGANTHVLQFSKADNSRLTHCRFRGHGDGSGVLVILTGSNSQTDTVDYCLFLGDNSVEDGLKIDNSSGTGLHVIDHNTFHGSFTTQAVNLRSANGTITFTNNIIENTSSSDIGITLEDSSFLADTKFDFNITHSVTTTKRYHFTPGTPATDIESVTAWADSLQTIVSGTNADNSLGQDPLLLNEGTTCTIDGTSPAEGAAQGGLDMGYYQFTAAGGRRRFIGVF